MVKVKQSDGLTKFQRYRRMQHSRGMKLLRLWVPDPTAADFQEHARRQAACLRGAPEEAEALSFIQAATEWQES